MSNLLTDIETFCADHGMSVWDFGSEAMGDRPFVGQLRKNRRVWPETEAKARKFIAEYVPPSERAA